MLRQGPGYILYALMDAVVDRYFPILGLLEDELDSIEARIFAPEGVPRENIEALYSLKERLMVMKHAVTPLLEGVSNLSGARVPALCAELGVYFRDVYDHLARAVEMVEMHRDLLAGAMDIYLSSVANRTNQVMKVLTVLGTIALPAIVISGLRMTFTPPASA